MARQFSPAYLDKLILELERLRDDALIVERALSNEIEQVNPVWRNSARNLAHYVALRSRDLRELQDALATMGLSSLGRAEAHTLASIGAVLTSLSHLANRSTDQPLEVPVDFTQGTMQLDAHTCALLGPRPLRRATHIMVTMPAIAADDPTLMSALLEAGMDCARINTAHDDPGTWERIASRVREASISRDRACRILVDLPGPKLRTAPLPEGPRTMHIKPTRGVRGELITPARVLLTVDTETRCERMSPHDALVPLLGEGLRGTAIGDTLVLRDLRGRQREFKIVDSGPDWRLAHFDESAWIETGLAVELRHGEVQIARGYVGELVPVEQPPVVNRGDALWIVSDGVPARAGSPLGPARVGCTLEEVFRDARVGEPIHIDDGRVAGVIRAVVTVGPESPRLEVEITTCVTGGAKIHGDKGINLPHTRFALPALTASDVAILEHAARFADMIGMSFVNEPEDVLELQTRLTALGRDDMGIVLKIETARAFQNLPRLILTGLRSSHMGVMVARGDLGVEMGFERLAEVQEEILWLCEAAHVPVIWATQVLESLAKTGQPSRAEVTDAAMGARAECVMLNKGSYVLDAVIFLDDVLRRMQDHHQKKSSRLRRLSICGMLAAPPTSSPGIG